MDAVSPAVHGSRDRRPEIFALAAVGAWWLVFLERGSFAATGLFAALAAAAALLGAVAARRHGLAPASARAARGLLLATAASSVALALYAACGADSRKVTEDLMELGVIHLALFGPTFLAALLCAWLGRRHAPPPRVLCVVYPLSWALLLALERGA